MKKKFKKVFENSIRWSVIIIAGLIIGFSIQFVKAWTEPPAGTNPPDGNVGAPINTGANQQLKGDFLAHIGSISLAGVLETFGFKMPTGAVPGYVLTAIEDPLKPGASNGEAVWAPSGGGGTGKYTVECVPGFDVGVTCYRMETATGETECRFANNNDMTVPNKGWHDCDTTYPGTWSQLNDFKW